MAKQPQLGEWLGDLVSELLLDKHFSVEFAASVFKSNGYLWCVWKLKASVQMKQRENINFELLMDPILEHGTHTDSHAPQKIMRATVLCWQEQEVCHWSKAPSEDAEMLHDKKVITKNIDSIPNCFGLLVTWSLLGTSFYCYSDKAQQLWKKIAL